MFFLFDARISAEILLIQAQAHAAAAGILERGATKRQPLQHDSEKKDPAQPSRASEAPLEHRRGHRHSVYRPDAAPGQTMVAPVKEDGLCSQIWNSTLKGGAAAAFWAFAARATATRCSGESSGLLGAAPAMSLGEDNSWRSLGAAAVSALPRTVNGTGHTGPSEFCATSI